MASATYVAEGTGGEVVEREKFMQEARLTAHRILEGKENGIMNLVQQAWAEGKRNAEVETLRAAIDEALGRREPKEPPKDAVYPTWYEWLESIGVSGRAYELEPHFFGDKEIYLKAAALTSKAFEPIPADFAQKLGIEPKEG